MKIAFVSPRYGPDIPGGAEAEVRRTAENMAQHGLPVEVLTTCARDLYSDWSRMHHRPGEIRVNGVPVHRFPVAPRDAAAFDAVNLKLMSGVQVTPAEERVYMREMIRSPQMETHLAHNCREHIFIFIPYMFGTTYWGAQVCPERSYVIPCLHDESYARMSLLKPVFSQVRGLICHSQPEVDLALSLYGLSIDRVILMGEGVDTDFSANAIRFRRRYRVDGPFVLYAGRKDPGKNVDLLLRYHRRYQQATDTDVKLVLIGSGELAGPVVQDSSVRDLGFVPLQDKYDAYAAATLLCNPSTNESFSLVMMEAWLTETPALVHADCAVTADFCRQSNAGLYFTDYPEFALALEVILKRPRLAAAMGRNGREFVLSRFSWDRIIDHYAELLGLARGRPDQLSHTQIPASSCV